MNPSLQNALDMLRSSGARNIPETSVVENSASGTTWHGQKRDGDQWYMVKHSQDSYNVKV